jgi:hypothetical protein
MAPVVGGPLYDRRSPVDEAGRVVAHAWTANEMAALKIAAAGIECVRIMLEIKMAERRLPPLGCEQT